MAGCLKRQWVMLTVLIWWVSPLWAGDIERPERLPLDARHQAVAGNERLGYEGESFAGYIETMRQRIAATRLDLQDHHRQYIIEGNAPFRLTPAASCPRSADGRYQKGILLTHGLTYSPFQMRDLGEALRKRCFLVYGLLLPGHGTRPGDLLQVSWRSWVGAEQFGLTALQREAEHVYLGGASTGATLALHAAAGNGDITGLLLFSPAVKITHWAKLAGWHALYSWAWQRGAWAQVKPDTDPFRYESLTLNAVKQVNTLASKTRARVKKLGLPMPVWAVDSWENVTVKPQATLALLQQSATDYHLRMYSVIDRELPASVTVVPARRPKEKVVSMAHTGLTVSPQNPHYGVNGVYADCIHYYKTGETKYQTCKRYEADYVGEITRSNLLLKGVIQRISYNPDWHAMLASLDRFLADD